MAGHTPTGAFPLHTPGRTAKASPSDVRRNNRSLIFSLLFPSHQYSRAELGRQTGLSRVAVSDVVNDMLDEGLIRENGYETGATGKGKRGTLLSIDTTRLKIISIDLSQSQLIQGATTDLFGMPQQRMEIALGPDNHVDVDAIVQLVDQLPRRPRRERHHRHRHRRAGRDPVGRDPRVHHARLARRRPEDPA